MIYCSVTIHIPEILPISLKSDHSPARPPLLIYRAVEDMKKAHDWYNVSDLMSCKYNDMINTVMTFLVNRITRSMKTEVKLSWSRSRLLHWM
jgi:hypothetical protein